MPAILSGGANLGLGVANKVRVAIVCFITGETNIAGNSRPTNSVEAAVRVRSNNDRPTQSTDRGGNVFGCGVQVRRSRSGVSQVDYLAWLQLYTRKIIQVEVAQLSLSLTLTAGSGW